MRKRDFLIAAVIALAVGAYDLRYPNYAPDQHIFGTMLLKDRSPDLFSRDLFFGDAELYAHYVPWYRAIARAVIGNSHGEELLFRYNLLLFPVLFFFVLGFFLLFHRLSGDTVASWIVAAAAIPSRPGISIQQFGIGLNDSMVAYKVFLAITPWLIWFFLSAARSTRRIILTFLFTGIASNFHPILGVGFAAVLALTLLIRRSEGAGATAVFAGLGAFGAGFSPYISLFLSHSPPADSGVMPAAEFWAAFSPVWGYIPVPPSSIRNFLIGAAPMLIFSALIWKQTWAVGNRNTPRSGDVRFFTAFAASVLIASIGVSAALQIQSRVLDRPPLIGLEPMRWTALIHIPLYALSALFLAGLRTGSFASRLFSTRVAVALVVFLLFAQKEFPGRLLLRESLLKNGLYSQKRTDVWKSQTRRWDDLMDLSRWVRANTPVDSLFFHPHYDFRFHAERSIVIGWKDGSMLTRAGSVRTREWLERASRVTNAVSSRDAGRVFDLARQLKCEYVILRAGIGPAEGIGAPIFQNENYKLYRVADDAGKS